MLVMSVVGVPGTSEHHGGTTLIQHFWYKNIENESGKYSRRGGDRQRTAHLQRANQILESYKKDPERHLKLIDEFSMEFLMRSQTDSERWYVLSLNSECCECEDQAIPCKHLLALRQLIKEELQHLRRLLPIGVDDFYHNDEGDLHIENIATSSSSTPPPNTYSGKKMLILYFWYFDIIIKWINM
jgi:hypothetical protein